MLTTEERQAHIRRLERELRDLRAEDEPQDECGDKMPPAMGSGFAPQGMATHAMRDTGRSRLLLAAKILHDRAANLEALAAALPTEMHRLSPAADEALRRMAADASR